MNIIMYSTGCPNCKRLEARLKKSGLKYEVCQDLEVLKEKNFSIIPVLEIDGETLTYRPAVTWVNKYIKEGGNVEIQS